eukprot:6891793-Prorocentrum_lima.AAC.1
MARVTGFMQRRGKRRGGGATTTTVLYCTSQPTDRRVGGREEEPCLTLRGHTMPQAKKKRQGAANSQGDP